MTCGDEAQLQAPLHTVRLQCSESF